MTGAAAKGIEEGKSAGPRIGVCCGVAKAMYEGIKKLNSNELAKIGRTPIPREDFNNYYLTGILNKLHYIKGRDWTISEEGSPVVISIINGILFITALKDSPEQEKLDKDFWGHMKLKIKRSQNGKVIIYSHTIQSKQDIEWMIRHLMGLHLKPSILKDSL